MILTQDLLAALIVVLTVPHSCLHDPHWHVHAQGKVDRQWATLARLSGHFVDVVAGMSTLKAFGRAGAQARTVREIGDRYRSTTMGVLRIVPVGTSAGSPRHAVRCVSCRVDWVAAG